MSSGDPSSDDLDQLLDSALDDFNKLDLSKSEQPSSSSFGPTGLGGMGLPDPKSRRKGKQRAQSTAPANYASEALEKLTQQTREAVRGLETVAGASSGGSNRGVGVGGGGNVQFNDETMVEEFVKQFEQLAGSQDMESIVETMMQQLLSKEILHEPMKEIAERYPTWLEENKSGLSKDEYNRYTRQYQFIVKLNEVYEKHPDNFTKIVDLMQKMQECGQPPNDIVKEIAPDLDMANLAQLSPEMFDSSQNCSIM